MKKFAIILSLLLVCFSAFTHEPYKGFDSFWITEADFLVYDHSETPMFHLWVAHYGDGTEQGQPYLLVSVFNSEIHRTQKLLIRTQLGDVIELICTPPNDDIFFASDTGQAFYPITVEQLDALRADVVKVRVQHDEGIYEHNYDSRTDWRKLATEYEGLVRAMKEHRANKERQDHLNNLQDIWEGF